MLLEMEAVVVVAAAYETHQMPQPSPMLPHLSMQSCR